MCRVDLMSSSNKGEGIRIQRCMRIVGCAGPRQKGHRSTRSTHAPQTAWPQSTNATDFEAAQHSAHWDASSPQRARSTTARRTSSPKCWMRASNSVSVSNESGCKHRKARSQALSAVSGVSGGDGGRGGGGTSSNASNASSASTNTSPSRARRSCARAAAWAASAAA